MKYKKRPIVVDAEILEKETTVTTPQGVMTGMPGDWLVVEANGVKRIYQHKDFVRLYEPTNIVDCKCMKGGQ